MGKGWLRSARSAPKVDPFGSGRSPPVSAHLSAREEPPGPEAVRFRHHDLIYL